MKNLMISDAHTDFLTTLKGEKLEKYLKSLSLQKQKLISAAIFTTNKNFSIGAIENLSNLIKNDKTLLLSIEDLGFIKNESDLNKLIALKPFSISLTWNYKNQFACGAIAKGGLTSAGIGVIKKLESSNIFVDTAHLNRESFYEFCRISQRPIYCSHANVFSLFKNPRNLNNKQIKIISNSGGFLGLTIYQKFISKGKISSKNIAKQFDYLIKHFGEDFFGFGSDLFGFDKTFLPSNIKSYLDFYKIVDNLKEMGYSQQTINKIFYFNFYNFVKKAKA